MARPIIIAAAVLFVFKLLLLAAIGPVFTPDTMGYIQFADTMLASRHWLDNADIATQAVPITAFRSLGYPAIIAAAKLMTGAAWPYAVVGLQFVASTAVFFAVYSLGLNLGLTARWALAGALIYATSLQLTLDQCILTDSLNASALILAVTIFLRGGAGGAKVGFAQTAASGVLIAIAFLIREAMPFLALAMIPLFAIRCALIRGAPWLTRILLCAIVWLPLVGAIASYQLWNLHRTGERFVTTGAQLNALWSLVQAAKAQPDIFSGDTPLERHVRPALKQYELSEVGEINGALFKDGYRAPAIARMAMDKYIAAWREHPGAMLKLVRIATSERVLKLVVRPVTAVCELIEWAEKPRCFDYRDLYRKLFRHPFDLTLREIPVFVAITIQNALSIALSALYFAGIPIALVLAWRKRGRSPDRPLMLAAGFWILGVGWHLIYAVAVYTDRYMAPAIPFMILGGLLAMAQFAPRLTRESAAP